MSRATSNVILITLLFIVILGWIISRQMFIAPPCEGDERFFPKGTFPVDYPASDEMRRQWYSATLSHLDEPSLFCDKLSGETYRLIWLHSYTHPVVIRITRHNNQIIANAFQLSGLGRGDPGVLLYHVQKQLTVTEWEQLKAGLQHSNFWSLPTSGNMYGAHGEQWIIEGRRGDEYHIVDRWTPSAGSYRDLGVLFFDLVGWQRPYSSEY
jgi:hypothetical protein